MFAFSFEGQFITYKNQSNKPLVKSKGSWYFGRIATALFRIKNETSTEVYLFLAGSEFVSSILLKIDVKKKGKFTILFEAKLDCIIDYIFHAENGNLMLVKQR